MSNHKEFQISYGDRVHVHRGSDASAAGWAEVLARDHDTKAVAEEVFTDGSRRHIVSHGDSSSKRRA